MLEEACPLMDYADKVTQGVALVYSGHQSIPTADDAKRLKHAGGISGGAYVSGLYAVKLGTEALMDIATAGQVLGRNFTGHCFCYHIGENSCRVGNGCGF